MAEVQQKNGSTYSMRVLRMYRDVYPDFVKVCRESGVSATKVLNSFIEKTVAEGVPDEYR